jgi:DNA-binding LacI/PurR family transcriptional regulator
MGRTGTIGIVAKTTKGAWFNEVLSGMEEGLAGKQVSMLLGSINMDGRYELGAVQAWVDEERVDALIFAHPGKPEVELMSAAAKAGLPMAFVAPDELFPTGHSFGGENREAGRELATLLVDLGHTKFAFSGGPESSQDTQDRLEGVRNGLQARGIVLAEEHITFAGSYLSAEGVRHAERWLAMPRSEAPTAVVLGNDPMALGFMRALQQQGVQIPRDVSVAGFDGLPEAGLCWPGLTTASQPAQQMGTDAVAAVLKQIQQPSSGTASSVKYPMQVIVRESTGPAPKAPGQRTAV